MEFNKLNISEPVLKAIEELGFKEATEVQSLSIPEIMNKKDLIVMAKTGSGKTGAFSLPIIEGIDKSLFTSQALIITPTRELAVQVNKDISSFTKYANIKTTTVYGGHSMTVEEKDLAGGAQIITGTPGRIIHHLKNRKLDTKNIKFLVLDEADRMLDMGFIDQMYTIIKALPKDRITLLFSATMPDEIKKICMNYMKNPITIEIDSDTKTVDTIKQEYIRVERNDKRTQLANIVFAEQPNSCMIFCNTRIEVDKVQNFLERKGLLAEAIHGANTQSRRMRTIEEFKNGEIQILVATDVAARGIHIDDMSLVINYDVPVEKDSYIHRIGRTGRAGDSGKAITMVTSDDLYALYEIEEHAGAMIEEVELPSADDIEEGQVILRSIWADKKAKRKPRSEAKPRSNYNTHNKSNSNQRKPHQKSDRREHAKMHMKPVQTQIEKTQLKKAPIQHKKPVKQTPSENIQVNKAPVNTKPIIKTAINKTPINKTPIEKKAPVKHNNYKKKPAKKLVEKTYMVNNVQVKAVIKEQPKKLKKKFSLKNLFKK